MGRVMQSAARELRALWPANCDHCASQYSKNELRWRMKFLWQQLAHYVRPSTGCEITFFDVFCVLGGVGTPSVMRQLHRAMSLLQCEIWNHFPRFSLRRAL